MAHGGTVTWTGSVNSDFPLDGNWSTGTVPTQGDVVHFNFGTSDFRSGTSSNYNAIRLKTGTLNVSGGTLKSTAHPAWDSWVGADNGTTGTINQTSGTAEINELE